jgi:hypothetical protein
MATRDDIYTAIRNADKAGDTASVQKLAAYLQTMPADAAPAAPAHVNSPAMTAKIDGDQISQDAKAGPSYLRELAGSAGDLLAGGIRGAGSIGATIMTAAQKVNSATTSDASRKVMDGAAYEPRPSDGPTLSSLVTGNAPVSQDEQRRQDMDNALRSLGADTSSPAFKVGKLGTEIAGTAGVGGAIAGTLRAAPVIAAAAPNLLRAVQTGGMTAGAGGSAVGNALTRVAGGAINGGASAGLVDPSQAGTGALVGGAMPVVSKFASAAGNAIGGAMRGGGVAPEVVALADRAKALGINIPADRLVDSKPLNALAATLNYVPFSGRAGTEAAMADQMNTALSRTFGQNSPNVTQALRKASGDLGAQFDTVLKSNSVKMTPAFQTSLGDASKQATAELGPEQAAIINRQIAEIQGKAALTGEIDGQTAYNIKKTLDRIGERNSPEAFYARDLKKKLMVALNDSMAPADAASFAKLRQQYGNMLDLENLATNGAEGGVSIGRLANLKNIGNPDVQELADIAAQFLKTRENPHGALQRLVIGGGAAGAAGGMGALPLLPVTAAAGRGANALLNSSSARNYVLGKGAPNALSRLLSNDDLAQLAYRAAPVTSSDR